jgi:DNA-binding GntR family transcriptional regulator
MPGKATPKTGRERDAGQARRETADPSAPDGPRTLYLGLVDTLKGEIADGQYEVGQKLPTELDLCQRFGVSRSVVRQALGEMEAEGLVKRRQGSGTTLISRQPSTRYILAIGSEPEILRYASETVFEVIDGRRLVPIGDSRRLGLGDPSGWSQWRGLRRTGRDGLPLGLTTLYLPDRYADVMDTLGRYFRRAIFDVIAERHGTVVTSVHQTISATVLDGDEAESLQSSPGMPALAIIRRFSSSQGVFEVAASIHPADRFSYELRLEREQGRITTSP